MSTKNNHHVVIIAGGAGTRLWPLSRKALPKQFQKLAGEETLIQHIYRLARQVVPAKNISVIATEEFSETIHQQLPEIPCENYIFEPSRRDNGPAITLAMLAIQHRDPEATVALLWSDHFIQDPSAFASAINTAFAAASKNPHHLVTVGAKPTYPETGFGYIQMGKEVRGFKDKSVFEVRSFIEKPNYSTALRYIQSWEYLWNVGYEICNVRYFFQEFHRIHPELELVTSELTTAIANGDREALSASFEKLPKMSIEFLFTLHLKDIYVVPADMGWSDVGNWNILHDVLRDEENSMVTRGPVQVVNSTNSLVIADNRLIALVGMRDVIVVDTGDTLLVMHKEAAQDMKELNALLADTNPEVL